MTIVMGLDRHRVQITAELLDTAAGELSRKRIAPADRAQVRAFAARFRDQWEPLPGPRLSTISRLV